METINDPFSLLPTDNIIQIALYESIDYVTKMCRLSRRFNDIICNNNNFWKDKFITDFGHPKANITIDAINLGYRIIRIDYTQKSDIETHIINTLKSKFIYYFSSPMYLHIMQYLK
jgi:hypothetical protein